MRNMLAVFVTIGLSAFPCISANAQKPVPIALKADRADVAKMQDATFDVLSMVIIQRLIKNIYTPYSSDNAPAPWETKHFSPKLAKLISQWRIAIKGQEMTNMTSYDWFCQCQDYDAKTARLGDVRIFHSIAGGPVSAEVDFHPGWEAANPPLIIELAKSKSGGWLVNDLIFEGDVRLTTQLKREIKTKGAQ
jgi:hypothetical protein